MSVRVVCAALSWWAVMAGGAVAVEGDAASEAEVLGTTAEQAIYTEERSLSDLQSGMTAFVLSPSQNQQTISFTLPPNADATEAWLNLAARPASESTTGRIHVSLNGGDSIVIRPQARAMEARFALYSDDVRPGENTLEIAFTSDSATAGWIVDASRSQLRLSMQRLEQLGSLGQLEETLGADFATLRRVALVTEDNAERPTVEGLAAQAMALRAGRVPLFGGDADNADLVVRIAEYEALSQDDRALLRHDGVAIGPEIAFAGGTTPRIVVTGRNVEEATAAARLLAARSFADQAATLS